MIFQVKMGRRRAGATLCRAAKAEKPPLPAAENAT